MIEQGEMPMSLWEKAKAYLSAGWNWLRRKQQQFYAWSKTERGRLYLYTILPTSLCLVLGVFGFKYYVARQLMTLCIALLIATTSYNRFQHSAGARPMVTGGLGY